MPDDRDVLVAEPASPGEYLPDADLEEVATEARRISFDFIVALAAKGFVILTGHSGTGKSKCAIELGQALDGLPAYNSGARGSSYELVPVGADWTDARPLVGYRNMFGSPRTRADGTSTNLSYEIPPCLRILLRAGAPSGSGDPYILILDEMNLSHVERYFNPFLSLMEANRSIATDLAPPLVSQSDCRLIEEILSVSEPNSPEATAAAEIVAGPEDLPVPGNLLVVGTVNVDETTYMFSPKVLDRAHVIEMSSIAPSAYLRRERPEAAAMSVEQAYALLSWAIECRRNRVFDQHPTEIVAAMKSLAPAEVGTVEKMAGVSASLLDGAYALLEPVGFAFGFRAVNEFFAYLLCWVKARGILGLDLVDWHSAIDRAFLQKVLPKIHGNRRQLGDSLSAVAAFLAGSHQDSTPPARYRLGSDDAIGISEANKLEVGIDQPFPRCRSKLASMHRQLMATGYVTFIR